MVPLEINSITKQQLSNGLHSAGRYRCSWTEEQPLFIRKEVTLEDYLEDKKETENIEEVIEFFKRSTDRWYFYEVSTD